ncbi:MAG: DNA ligase D [Acidobacteria bacterium]|nr:MAG: DNA ligase D [Acidobacteriota bacterium]REK10186.1 MAG: DNA ligase D [Acidobacteriota bacterium]
MPKKSDLSEYRRKRTPGATPEPFGAGEQGNRVAVGSAGEFVVQLHAARRSHYDLRLELDGTLKSWAVPRGPSLDPAEKRLAVQTEDHPLDYGGFEGVIPEGHYGAGAMIVWDRGVWLPLEDPEAGLVSGKLLFELRGFKLRGVWTLFRTKPSATQRGKSKDEDRQWILMKKPDAAASTAEAPFSEASILSGLTVEELRDGARRVEAIRGELPERRSSIDPRTVRPMLAEVADGTPRDDPEWVFEIKYDGYRMLAARRESGAFLRYRNGAETTHLFPEIAQVLAALPVSSCLIDGEVVVLGPDGRPSFGKLQQRAQLARNPDVKRAAIASPATFFAFDLLELEGRDLRALPLVERKRILAAIVPQTGPVRLCEHIAERGADFYRQVEALQLEGMVAKRADSPYVHRRSGDWLKYRVDQSGLFAIVGYRLPKVAAARAGFSALHIAARDPAASADGGLRYAGRVGTGFDDALLRALRERLEALEIDQPVCPVSPTNELDRWVEPELICQVRFKEWTEAGNLRHPVYLGLREDLGAALAEAHPAGSAADEPPAPPPKLHLTNLDKVFWPTEGYTKGDLIDYYRAIAPRMLPFLRDRPLVMTRFPDGIDGKSFFQKHSPDFAPGWIRTEKIWSGDGERDTEYFVCNDEDTLVYLANLATIPIHVWSSRLDALDRPDWCILDLDPKQAPFTDVVRIAREAKRLCDEIGLESFVKTSGSSGLHVLLPLARQCDYEQSRALASLLAQLLSRRLPEIATVVRNPEKRDGKVYVDFVQNGRGRLLVAPYCVRPLPTAPVSTPLRWSEVRPALRIEDHTIRSVPQRVARQRDDPWADLLETTPDLLAALQRLGELIEASGE